MKLFSRPLSAIFLIIPGTILILSLTLCATPGGMIVFLLAGLFFCLPSLAFSKDWAKWVAMGMALYFIAGSYGAYRNHLQSIEARARATAQEQQMLEINLSPKVFAGNESPIITIIQIYDPMHAQPVSLDAGGASEGQNLITMNTISEAPLLERSRHPLQLRVSVYSWEVREMGTFTLKRKDFINLPPDYEGHPDSPDEVLLTVTHTDRESVLKLSR